MRDIIIASLSAILFVSCGGEEEEKKGDEDTVVAIDTSNVEEIEDINTTQYVCRLGEEELVQGGGPYPDLDRDQWKMTLDSGIRGDLIVNRCKINTGELKHCLQVDPQAPGTGMYQKVIVQSDKRYRIRATLLGADNYKEKNNFDLGNSYVSIEDHKPAKKSQPIAYSKKIKGNTPKDVAFDFDAKKEIYYIQLRSDKAFRYPTTFFISLRELIMVEKGNEENLTQGNTATVPCNL